MTYNEVAKAIEELVQRRIQLKIKLSQTSNQNTFIDSILAKNQALLVLANNNIKQLVSADLVNIEDFLRMKASCEPVMAVIDANLFKKRQNVSQIIVAKKEIKELDFERKRLEGMLNETSRIHNLFQKKDRKGREND